MRFSSPNPVLPVALCASLLLAMVAAEAAMGHVWMSASGTLQLWVGSTASPETSQQVADWYSFSHFLHGVIFWAALRALTGRLGWGASAWALLVPAIALECGWEVLENSPIIIDRYRQTALNIGYNGDSILNSVCDVLFMVFGFWMASRCGWKAQLGLFVALEVLCAVAVRDNLTLNVVMLMHPVPAIEAWQVTGER